MATPPNIALGVSDFAKLRGAGAFYADKTAWIAGVLTSPSEVLLFPRPRRFGKTLNLSSLRYFAEKSDKDTGPLFRDLDVWSSEGARAHHRRYPVVSLSFKDVKARTFPEILAATRREIGNAIDRHAAALADAHPSERQRTLFEQIARMTADKDQVGGSVREITDCLARAAGEKVLLLVDEYDTPLQAAYGTPAFDDTVELFRLLLSNGLKDNPSLFKGVLTGIHRVSRESYFSGLNHLSVYSSLEPRHASAFGFTEPEVLRLLEFAGVEDRMGEVRAWYNGYDFGGTVIYNPWSVLSFAANPARGPLPHWVNTSDNSLMRTLLIERGLGLWDDMETLLSGGSIEKPIQDSLALRDIAVRGDAVWSLLLFGGYLKATGFEVREGDIFATLTLPNEEVRYVYRTLFRDWMTLSVGLNGEVQALLRALLGGDADVFERLLEKLMLTALSYHDVAAGGAERRTPEKVYQAFILGLLVHLAPRYSVRANRESGLGRYDVLVCPRDRGQPGVVIELKVLDTRRNETVEQALDRAPAQIKNKKYSAELEGAGASPIHEMAAVFDGKRVWARKAT